MKKGKLNCKYTTECECGKVYARGVSSDYTFKCEDCGKEITVPKVERVELLKAETKHGN
jgi:hypothetical protein